MDFKDLDSYEAITAYLRSKNRKCHLLFGNGFSIAYDKEIFSYNALAKLIDQSEDSTLRKLFEVTKTRNFELIMRQIEDFLQFANAFGRTTEMTSSLRDAKEKLAHSLLEAVESLHPAHVFKITDTQVEYCVKFLSFYLATKGNIFSTNYDLLLYWVSMRKEGKLGCDGFGRYASDGNLVWGPNLYDQNIFFLHGTLPYFDTGADIEKEVYNDQENLLTKIKARMDAGSYPIFVTAGTAQEKLEQISHNKYLSHAYEKLCRVGGSLVIIGFNFGDYDSHIIEAINKAASQSKDKLVSVYIGVYSESNFQHLEGLVRKIKCKVKFYNSGTASIWGSSK